MARRLSLPVRLLRACARWLDRLARAIYARVGDDTSDAELLVEPPSEGAGADTDAPAHWLARVRAKGPPADWLERVRRARLLNPHANFAGRANLNHLDATPVQRDTAPLPMDDAAHEAITSSERASKTSPRETIWPPGRKPLRFHPARAHDDVSAVTSDVRVSEEDDGVAAKADERSSALAATPSTSVPLKSREPHTSDAHMSAAVSVRSSQRATTNTTRTHAQQAKASPAFLRAAEASRRRALVEPAPTVEREIDEHTSALPVRARHESDDAQSSQSSPANSTAERRGRAPSAAEHVALPGTSEWEGRWPPIITQPRAANVETADESALPRLPSRTPERVASRTADVQWSETFSARDESRSVAWPEPMVDRWPSLPHDGGASEPSALAALRDWERWQHLDAEQREV